MSNAVNSLPMLERSKQLLMRAHECIPGCAQTFSKGPGMFVQGVAPNFIARGDGAYVWDVDENRYIDYILGLGPVILGHACRPVNEAVMDQMSRGVCFSIPHEIEVEVSEMLREIIPCAEMVRFGKNGSDATTGAVRLARAYTKRDKILCCGYHGWQDWFIGTTSRNLGVPEAVRNLTIPFAYNDLAGLKRLFDQHASEVACVIMEPVNFTPPQQGYLPAVKELCHRNGALLIFDEVVTGFRLHLGGAQAMLGVTPDLACFGKAMANGFPLSALVGRSEVMRLLEEVFFSFTFGGDTLGLAACKATIHEMRKHNVISRQAQVGQQLKDGTNRLLEDLNLQSRITCIGYPQWTTFSMKDAGGKPCTLLRSLFQQESLRRGLLTHGSHLLSLAHTSAVVDETLGIYSEVFEIIADAIAANDVRDRLVGEAIRPVFRQV